MKFQIEFIFNDVRPAYLFARQIDAGAFSVSERSRLGGVPIKPFISQPRKLTPEGKPDLTYFTFTLASANDSFKLAVGQIAELKEDIVLTATAISADVPD